jgi:large subunit ribosomal protein L35
MGKKGQPKVKLKTNKGAAKRFRTTKTGKIKKRTAGRSHVLSKKSRKRKRHMRSPSYLSGAQAKQVRRLLPYG